MNRLISPFRWLASLKVAIPLLVILAVATIGISLLPTPELFGSSWYLGLLGILGLSLLFVTIQHAPMILKRKGRNALIGVITTHLGILVVIAGIIYGGYSGFRHQVRLIEGDAKIVAGLPFVVVLDRMVVEEYRQEDYPRMDLDVLPKKRQDSHITLLKQGKPWKSLVVAPGAPARVEGITLLPAVTDIGWYFELLVTDALDNVKTIPVRPWELPDIRVGERQVMVHAATRGELEEVELFTIEDGELTTLGSAGREVAVEIDDLEFRLGPVKRYTGMQVYSRPQEPILAWGCVLMFAGLVWHFYFRHRDRRRDGQRDA